MVICPACRHANPPGSRFCNACGARVAVDATTGDRGAASAPQDPAIGPTTPHGPPADPATAELLPGAQIGTGGRYLVEQAIGRGGFGQAYLVRDQQLGRYCVAKRQLPSPAWSERAREQAYQNFRREAQLLSTLNTPGHPNIPEIFEYLPDLHCLVMKYVEGRDLGWVLASRGGVLPLDEGLAIIREVCSALAYMHSRRPEPVLHRDIKPSNILIDSAGRVWLIDFGLSKATPVQAIAADPQHTQMAGTFGFSPPEQWRGESVPRSDIYALCATLHMLVSGYQPTLDRGDLPDFLRGKKVAFPPARSVNAAIPAAVETLIARGLAFDPAQRPTAAELLSALERLLAPQARADLQAPDGAALADELALARWAEQHWDAAALWLYANLADQVAQLWGKNRLAGDIRALVGGHAADQHAGLDALLAALDPAGFGAASPRLTADRRAISFGQLDLGDRRDESIQLSNAGRRYVRVEIQAPPWVAPGALSIALPPGRQQQLRLTADVRRATEGGHLRGAVLLRDRSGAGFRIEVDAQISRWRALWQRTVSIGGRRRYDWEGGEVRPLRLLAAHRGGVWAIAFSPDGRQIASGGWDQSARLWRAGDGAAEHMLDNQGGNVLAVAYSPDGRLLAVAGNSDLIKLWRLRDRQLAQSIGGHRSYVESLHFSPDGQLLIGGGDQQIGVWRVGDGSLVRRLSPPAGARLAACHPDGRSLALIGADRTIRLWDLGADAPLATLSGHGADLNSLAYSRAGGLLVSGDVNGVVCLWDLDAGSLRLQLRGHQGGVRCLAVHPDGQLVASGGVDGGIRLWRSGDGAQLQLLTGHSSGVLGLAFSPAGDLLASGGGDGSMRLWQPG